MNRIMSMAQKPMRIKRNGSFPALIVFMLVSSFLFIHTVYADTPLSVTALPNELSKEQAESIAHEFLKAQFAVREEEIE